MSVLTIAALQTKINNWIKTNGNNEITGAQMNEILIDMVDSLINRLDDAGGIGLSEYNPSQQYVTGTCCILNGIIFQANADTTGAFDVTKWNVIYFRNGKLYTISAPISGLGFVGLGEGVSEIWTMSASKMTADGDEILIRTTHKVIGGDSNTPAAFINFGSTLGVAGAFFPPIIQDQIVKAEYRIVRKSNTQVLVSGSFACCPDPSTPSVSSIINLDQLISGLNLTTNPYDIEVSWIDLAGGTRTAMSIQELSIELIKQIA